MFRRALVPTALVFAVAACLSVATASTANAETCKKKATTAFAFGNIQFLTKSSARSAWRKKVRKADGREFAGWRESKDKVEKCDEGKSGYKWRCRVAARPCSKK